MDGILFFIVDNNGNVIVVRWLLLLLKLFEVLLCGKEDIYGYGDDEDIPTVVGCTDVRNIGGTFGIDDDFTFDDDGIDDEIGKVNKSVSPFVELVFVLLLITDGIANGFILVFIFNVPVGRICGIGTGNGCEFAGIIFVVGKLVGLFISICFRNFVIASWIVTVFGKTEEDNEVDIADDDDDTLDTGKEGIISGFLSFIIDNGTGGNCFLISIGLGTIVVDGIEKDELLSLVLFNDVDNVGIMVLTLSFCIAERLVVNDGTTENEFIDEFFEIIVLDVEGMIGISVLFTVSIFFFVRISFSGVPLIEAAGVIVASNVGFSNAKQQVLHIRIDWWL